MSDSENDKKESKQKIYEFLKANRHSSYTFQALYHIALTNLQISEVSLETSLKDILTNLVNSEMIFCHEKNELNYYGIDILPFYVQKFVTTSETGLEEDVMHQNERPRRRMKCKNCGIVEARIYTAPSGIDLVTLFPIPTHTEHRVAICPKCGKKLKGWGKKIKE